MRLISFSLSKILNPCLIIQVTGYCTLARERASAEPEKCAPSVSPCLLDNQIQDPLGQCSCLETEFLQVHFLFLSICGCGDFMRWGFLIWEYLGSSFFFFLQTVQCPVSTSQISKIISVGRWHAQHLLECVCSSILYYVKRNSTWSLEILKLCITPV